MISGRRRRAAWGFAALAVAAVVYLCAWPVPVRPVRWRAPVFTGYAGAHVVNEGLAAIELVRVAPYTGPEHIEVGPDGALYTGVLTGEILRIAPDGTRLEIVANTGGRPLGLAFDAGGRLIVADALRGVLAVHADRTVEVVVDRVDDDPVLYADAVIVASDGRIIFTDATERLSPREFGTFDAALLDIIEHTCTGRVLEHDPASGRTGVIISSLCFPNGVVLSRDERHLFVAETGQYRIWKIDADAHDLDARAAADEPGDPRARVIADNLPGFPDNLTRGAKGRIWTGLTKPRSAAIDGLADHPMLRAMTLRLPKALWPVPPAYGHVIAFDEDGHVVADLQDPAGRLPETSGVTEHDGRLYVQSLHAQAFGVLDEAAVFP